MLERVAQRQRDGEEEQRERALDREGGPQRVARDPARAAVGDRAREQLLDGTVGDADDHEHHRPQHVELAVLRPLLGEHVACDGEVREGQDAGRGDAD